MKDGCNVKAIPLQSSVLYEYDPDPVRYPCIALHNQACYWSLPHHLYVLVLMGYFVEKDRLFFSLLPMKQKLVSKLGRIAHIPRYIYSYQKVKGVYICYLLS